MGGRIINTDAFTFTRKLLTGNLYFFTRYFFAYLNGTKFFQSEHFRKISHLLTSVLNNDHPTNCVMINMPPRSGKTEMAIVNFAAMGFAINPTSEFMHLSTSASLVNRNVTNMRKIMNCDPYRMFFPETELDNNASGSIKTTAGGTMYAAPFLGQITGFGCGRLGADKFSGAMLIDDPVKTQDAMSDTIREKVNFTWANTIVSRKNDSKTPIIVTAQRTHENDFCGFLLQEEGTIEEGGKWDVLELPAIITTMNEAGEEVEESIWEQRLPLEYLHRQRDIDPWVFDTQYMQQPRALEGLMYPNNFKTWDVNASIQGIEKCYIDTADEGKDYLCAIYYIETSTANYVTDLLYTQKAMEFTEPATAEMINRNNTKDVIIESNNGGRGFARNVEQILRNGGNMKTKVHWFTQRDNKNVRIFSHSAEVQNITYFPEHWETLWPDFYIAIAHYMKVGRNAHDDAPDALTGTIENRGKNNIDKERLYRIAY